MPSASTLADSPEYLIFQLKRTPSFTVEAGVFACALMKKRKKAPTVNAASACLSWMGKRNPAEVQILDCVFKEGYGSAGTPNVLSGF